jgi:pimeloyl-ACP methyl ester carboxylesterase
VQLAYDDVGQGPALIWGHGLSSSRANEDAGPLLDWSTAAAGRRLVRYDARGHGTSGFTNDPAGYGWADLARDQLALADALGIDRYVAGGASMGCGTALHAALLAPDRVEALLLVIPPTAWETRRERADLWAQVSAVIEAKGVEPFIRSTADMPPPDPFIGRPERREAHDRHLRGTDPVRLAGVFRGAATADLPPREQLRTIGVPTQILAWSGDPAHPESTAEQLAELMPHAELAVARTWDELQTWTGRAATFLAGLPHPAR